MGAAKLLMGGLEMMAGYSFGVVTSPTVVGGIVGAAVGTHGVDVAAAGIVQLFIGEVTRTTTSQIIESLGTSQEVADVTDAGLSAVATLGLNVANDLTLATANGLTIVSRWGSKNLECGGWVMKGRATYFNYFKSGKWQFFGDNQFSSPGQWREYLVPTDSLRLPGVTDEAQCGWRIIKYIKGFLGQRIYDGPTLR